MRLHSEISLAALTLALVTSAAAAQSTGSPSNTHVSQSPNADDLSVSRVLADLLRTVEALQQKVD